LTEPTTRRRIALTVGDPNGIGPEIVLKALEALGASGEAGRLDITVFGPRAPLEQAAALLGLGAVLERTKLQLCGDVLGPGTRFGLVEAEAGVSAVTSATAAIVACRAGEFDAIVAGPHHETAIAKAGIRFSGYPSLLARVSGQPEDQVFLMLVTYTLQQYYHHKNGLLKRLLLPLIYLGSYYQIYYPELCQMLKSGMNQTHYYNLD
jgi:4-hydroxythreonine-4-phosphate dehydrogenase/1,2-dihydroxy-3,5-cyclohexadiene-1,4-dicarboxylate dehydrogenase